MLIHRPAKSDSEVERAVCAVGGDAVLPPDARWFLALAARPVERIVGAAAWWLSDGETARFHWSMIHVHASGESAEAFLRAFTAEAASSSAATLRTVSMLPPKSDAALLLERAGFQRSRRNVLYEIPGSNVRERARRVGERIQDQKAQNLIHAEVRLAPLTQQNAGAVWKFIQPEGLMPEHEFAGALKAGLLRDYSVVLEVRGKVCGAYLCMRQSEDSVCVPVFCVACDSAISRHIGSALLVHTYAMRPGTEEVRVIHLRADPALNPSTPRLALRYGGQQTGELWSYERSLTDVH